MKQLLTDILCKIAGCTDCEQFITCSYLKFAIISMIFGLLSVIVDYIIFKMTETSYLKIRYLNGVALIMVFWTIGSLIVGYIGAVTQIFDTTKMLSALVVGISWQLIFARWAAGKFENEDYQPINAN